MLVKNCVYVTTFKSIESEISSEFQNVLKEAHIYNFDLEIKLFALNFAE